MPGKYCDLIFEKSITRWDEAIPLGNGQMGCLAWGEPGEFRLSLDRADLWDTSMAPGIQSPAFNYASLVKLAQEKQTEKIREIFDAPYQASLPTKLPAGRIVIKMQSGANIRSRLHLHEAAADFVLEKENGEFPMKGYVHALEGFGYFWLGLPSGEAEITLENPPFGTAEEKQVHRYSPEERKISQGSLKQLCYERAEKGEIHISDGARLLWYTQRVGEDFSYGVVLGIKNREDGQHLYYCVAVSGEGSSWLGDTFTKIRGYMETDTEILRKSHLQWWREYWEKSAITIPDKRLEKMWYLSGYFLASCSRKGGFPMALQGVWTADEESLPPWKGDYHNDLNTQMSYYHYLKANHLLEGECFLDFLESLSEKARDFARSFYGTKGHCLPGVMAIDGQPLGGWPMYSLSPVNQIWLAWLFERYYRYTGDLDFLRERAYPYLAGTGEFICGLLHPGENGLLYLPVSSSPEIHDDEAEAFVTPNSNYDLALLRFLFETLEEFAGLVDEAGRKRWRALREKLPVLAVTGDGVLMLSPDERLTESHRHMSNAMAVHPLRLLRYRTPEEKRVIDRTVADYESLGTAQWTGFSFCWMAELYAVQGNGEKAAEQLRIFYDYFCSPNGFHLNGDYTGKGYSDFTYRPFTLEANMCAADALQEMLLYTEKGELVLFPAIPRGWEEKGAAFFNLRGEGGILVSAKLESGKLKEVYIYAPRPLEILLRSWDEAGCRSGGTSRIIKLETGKNKIF